MKIGPLVIIRDRRKISAKDVVRSVVAKILSEDEYLRSLIAKKTRAVIKDYLEDECEKELDSFRERLQAERERVLKIEQENIVRGTE